MSLNQRIILSASIVLLIFITLTAAALNRAYVESSETALHDRVTSQLFALMSAAEVDEDGITMPSDELDALLGLPSSGVYAYITQGDGDILWRSSSVLEADPPAPLVLASGEKRFYTRSTGRKNFLIHAYGVSWAVEAGDKTIQRALTFNLITDLQSYNEQLKNYRSTLWRWLLAMALLLLITQTVILRWGLSPLRQVSSELSAIENGDQEQIVRHYPREIERLTDNINQLLQQEREQKTRYRNALGDLAHSLKTPLAILHSNLDSDQRATKNEVMLQQLDRMNGIVEYQLKRAATAGSGDTGQAIDLRELVDRITESMQKIYQEKNLSISNHIDASVRINADEGDMMELFGNLLDNACKWAHSSIEIYHTISHDRHLIHFLDDGPGIAPDQALILLQRGVRADESIAGHGIGLSIVRDIVDAYGGDIRIDTRSHGGAEITVTLGSTD